MGSIVEASSCVGALCGRVTRQDVMSNFQVGGWSGIRKDCVQNYHLDSDDEMVLSQSCILFLLIGIPREVCLVQMGYVQLDGFLPIVCHDGDVPKWCQLYRC